MLSHKWSITFKNSNKVRDVTDAEMQKAVNFYQSEGYEVFVNPATRLVIISQAVKSFPTKEEIAEDHVMADVIQQKKDAALAMEGLYE